MIWAIAALLCLVIAVTSAIAAAIYRKHMQYWLKAHIFPVEPAEEADPSRLRHVFIAVCDHWEPANGDATDEVAMQKVERWAREYPRVYGGFRDSDGRPPQHTFFYPAELYKPEHIDKIAELCRAGFGDVEVHLHHHSDTAAQFEATLTGFRDTLFHRHGLLRRDPRTGAIAYGFIHGNWALCNSHPNGIGCGVDHELDILQRTGCYADFTMPSAPHPTQTRIINSIYYARDIPGRRKSHDVGVRSRVGQDPLPDHLLMIQGPLTLDWTQRRLGVLPRIENGDLIAGRPMSLDRLRHWLRADVHVRGQPNWKFVKLHTHGCKDGNIDAWLGSEMQQFHGDLARHAKEDPRVRLHYVTAWEMAQLVHQAESGAVTPSIARTAREAVA